jgi:hypothetical protein
VNAKEIMCARLGRCRSLGPTIKHNINVLTQDYKKTMVVSTSY